VSDDGNAGSHNQAGQASGDAVPAAPVKRKVRTPEEILKDIEAEEQEQIRKIQARAAERKAEVEQKIRASSKKTVAIELLDKIRADIKAATKNESMTDEAADAVLQRIVEEGLARLAAAPAHGPSAAAANAAPVAQAA
jgi:hypothetical protein